MNAPVSLRTQPPGLDEQPAQAALRSTHGGEYQRAQQELMARGYIQFHPVLANALGGFKPALMLGHAMYWTRKWLAEHPERDGWFWKTSTEWRDATGLSQREQEGARTTLRDSQVWQEQIGGSPARLFYRLDLSVLGTLLRTLTSDPQAPRADAASDEDAPPPWLKLAELLGRPVFFFRPLADISGGVAPGLVLSQLLAEYRLAINSGQVDPHGFFHTGVEEARIALGLGIKVQRNAREALKRAGLVQEAWTQEQRPRLMVRVNLQAILACLSGQAPGGLRRARKVPRRAAGPSIESVPVQQSLLPIPDRAVIQGRDGNVTQVARLLAAMPGRARRAHGAEHEPAAAGAKRRVQQAQVDTQQALTDAKGCPFVETESEGCPFVEPRVALLSNLYTKRIKQIPTTARVREQDPAVDNSGSSRSRVEEPESQEDRLLRGDHRDGEGLAAEPEVEEPTAESLVFPAKLDPALRNAALKVLERAPALQRQQLLDELAGHMASTRKSIENPVGWLHALTARSAKGEAVFTMADGVAAARAARAEHEARMAAASAPAIRSDADRGEPAELSAGAKASRERLADLRRQLAGSSRGMLDSTKGGA